MGVVAEFEGPSVLRGDGCPRNGLVLRETDDSMTSPDPVLAPGSSGGMDGLKPPSSSKRMISAVAKDVEASRDKRRARIIKTILSGL